MAQVRLPTTCTPNLGEEEEEEEEEGEEEAGRAIGGQQLTTQDQGQLQVAREDRAMVDRDHLQMAAEAGNRPVPMTLYSLVNVLLT